MKKLLSIISIVCLTGCSVNKQAFKTDHLFQRLVLKTKTGPHSFRMDQITPWEPYRELDHRVGGDTMIQYSSTKRK